MINAEPVVSDNNPDQIEVCQSDLQACTLFFFEITNEQLAGVPTFIHLNGNKQSKMQYSDNPGLQGKPKRAAINTTEYLIRQKILC
jgi:hypothetical protein